MPTPELTTNPIKLWLTVLLAVFGLTAIGMVVFTFLPQGMGVVYEPLTAEASFTFDEWEIALSHGTLNYPQGGTAVEAFQYGRLSAIIVFGSGEFVLTQPGEEESEFSQEVSSVILFMSPDNLSRARGSTVIRSDVYADAMHEAQQMLDRESSSLPGIEVLGTFRHYPLDTETKRLIMLDPQGQRTTYSESLLSRLLSPYGNKVFLSTKVKSIDPPVFQALIGTLAYLIMLAFMATAAYFLTLDTSPGNLLTWPSPVFGLSLGLATLHVMVMALINRLNLAPIVQITWYLLMTAALLYLLNLGDVTEIWRRVRRQLVSGLQIGAVLAVLGLVLGTLTLPRGLGIDSGTDLAWSLLYGILWVGLAQELIWRGMVQTAFCSRFGILKGLLFTALAAGAISLLGALINPAHAGLVFLEALIVIPGRMLLLGFVYHRSRNIVAPITLSALLYILPTILTF